jgi:hypothetical protein
MEEKAVYAKNKPVMEQGLDGIKKALKVLRDYYAAIIDIDTVTPCNKYATSDASNTSPPKGPRRGS